MTRNQQMLAVGLEVAPGTFFGTFGIGHLYSGRIGTGVVLMIAYWAALAINAMLIPFGGLGFVTGILTWLGFSVFASTNLIGDDLRR